MGADPDTLIDELRVVAVVAEPPEAAPGESVTLTMHLSNPMDLTGSAGVWSCIGFDGQCLEQDPGRIQRSDELTDTLSWTLAAPLEAAALFEDLGRVPVPIWALACDSGLCPLLEDDEVCEESLADPYEMMKDLPLAGVSLAYKSLWVSENELETRAQNPILTPDFDASDALEAGETRTLCFSVSGEATDGYGYASAGGFSDVEFEVKDGTVSLDYVAPDDAESVTLWVVVQSESGGSALWTSTLEVTP
jgi:hypothetical protein